MSMSGEEYQGFLNRWLADVELATTTMRISDAAAVILLIGDRLLPILDGILIVLQASYELTEATMRRLHEEDQGAEQAAP